VTFRRISPVSASATKRSTEKSDRSEKKTIREPSGLSAGAMFSRCPRRAGTSADP
jgi:hypothetical protein